MAWIPSKQWTYYTVLQDGRFDLHGVHANFSGSDDGAVSEDIGRYGDRGGRSAYGVMCIGAIALCIVL